MKKVLLIVLIIVMMLVSVPPIFASYSFEKYWELKKGDSKVANDYMKRWNALNDKMAIFVNDMQKLADTITIFRKPIFEAQLTNEERKYSPIDAYNEGTVTSSVLWNRVYVNNKTLVFGMAGRNKKFTAVFFATTDPEFVFPGGICVGASTKTLENFFGDSMDNIKDVLKSGKIIVSGPQYDGIDSYFKNFVIVCDKGLITEIIADFIDDEAITVFSKKAGDFARNKLKQLGFLLLREPFFSPTQN